MNKKVLTLCVSALLAGTISSVDAFAQKYSMFTQPGTTANSFLKQGTAFQLADNDGRVLAIERTGSAYNYHYELKMVSVDASAELAETLWKVTYQENKEGGSSFTFTSAAYGIPLSFNPQKVDDNDVISDFPGTDGVWKWQTSLSKDNGVFPIAELINNYSEKLDSAIILREVNGKVIAQRYKTSGTKPTGLQLKPSIAAPAVLTVDDLNSMFMTKDPSGKVKLSFTRESTLTDNLWENEYKAINAKGVWAEGRRMDYNNDLGANQVYAAAQQAVNAIYNIDNQAGVANVIRHTTVNADSEEARETVALAAEAAIPQGEQTAWEAAKAAATATIEALTGEETAAAEAADYAESVYEAVKDLKVADFGSYNTVTFTTGTGNTSAGKDDVAKAMKVDLPTTEAEYEINAVKAQVKENFAPFETANNNVESYELTKAVTDFISDVPEDQETWTAYDKNDVTLSGVAWADGIVSLINKYKELHPELNAVEKAAIDAIGDMNFNSNFGNVTEELKKAAALDAAKAEIEAEYNDAKQLYDAIMALTGISTAADFNAVIAEVTEPVDAVKANLLIDETQPLNLEAAVASVKTKVDGYVAEKVNTAKIDLSAVTTALDSYKQDAATAKLLAENSKDEEYLPGQNAAVETVKNAIKGDNLDAWIASASEAAAIYPAGEHYANSEWISLYKKDGDKDKYLMVDTVFATSEAGKKDLAFAVKEYKSFWKEDRVNPTVKDGISKAFAMDFDGRYNFKFTYYPTQDSLVIVSDGYAQKPENMKYWTDMETIDVTNTKAEGDNIVKISVLESGTMPTLGEYETVNLAGGKTALTLNTRIGFNANPAIGATIAPGVYTIQYISTDAKKKDLNGRYVVRNWLDNGQAMASVEDQNLNHIPAAQWMLTHENGSNINTIVNRETNDDLTYFSDFAYAPVQYLYATATTDLYTTVYGDSLKLNRITDNTALADSTLGYYAAAKYNEETADQLEVYALKYLNETDGLFVNYNEDDSVLNVTPSEEAEVYFRLIPAQDFAPVHYGPTNDVLAKDLYRQAYYIQLETQNKNVKDEDKLYITSDAEGKYRLVTREANAKKELTWNNVTPFFLKEFKEVDGTCNYALIEAGNAIYEKEKQIGYNLGWSKVSVKDYPSTLVVEDLEGENQANYTWGYKADGRTSTFALIAKDAPKYRRLNVTDPEDGLKDNDVNYAKFFQTRNPNRFLYENTANAVAGYESEPLGLNFLGDYNTTEKDKNAAIFVDTAYVRNNTNRPQYMLALRPDFTPVLEDCPYDPSHGKHEIPQVKASYLVTLTDSVANAVNKAEQDKFMYENRTYTRLAFVDAIHRGDQLIILNSKFTGTDKAANDTIDLSKNAFVEGAWQFRLTGNDNAEFYIEGAKSGEFIRLVNGVAVLTDDISDAERFNIESTNEAATANESIEANGAVSVTAVDGAVVIKGAEGKNVVIATILGKVVANETVNSDNETIAVPAGIAVVSVDGESFKVVVK